MVGRVDIFGTKFCVPKGYVIGKGYTIECVVPRKTRETTPPKQITEDIRRDIEKLYNELGSDFGKKKFFKWMETQD